MDMKDLQMKNKKGMTDMVGYAVGAVVAIIAVVIIFEVGTDVFSNMSIDWGSDLGILNTVSPYLLLLVVLGILVGIVYKVMPKGATGGKRRR